MAVKCANHPGVVAQGKCSECGKALCAECRLTYKTRPVCERCLEEICHKLATDAEAVFEPGAGDAPMPEIDSQTATRSVEAVIAARERLEAASRPTKGRLLLLGSMLSLILGTVLALLIAKALPTYDWLSFGFLIAGGAVGFAMIVGAGDGGKVQGILAALFAFGTQVFGIYMLLNDSNAMKQNTDGTPVVGLSLGQFVSETSTVSIWDWIFVLGGVLAAFAISFRSKKASSSRF